MDRTLLVEVPSDRREPPNGATVRHFAFQTAPEVVSLKPAPANRPVVVCPEEPLLLPPREQVTLFISTPLWVELSVGESSVALLDEPTFRPTDTWFGPSTMKGELCYATRSSARMTLDGIPVRPHRAISVVEVRNKAKGTLVVEQLKIPAPQLSVFATADGNLWTEAVELDHQEDGAAATVRLGKGPPKGASAATLVRGPRLPLDSGFLTRAFGGLVG